MAEQRLNMYSISSTGTGLNPPGERRTQSWARLGTGTRNFGGWPAAPPMWCLVWGCLLSPCRLPLSRLWSLLSSVAGLPCAPDVKFMSRKKPTLLTCHRLWFPGAGSGLRGYLASCRSGSWVAPSALVQGQGAWTAGVCVDGGGAPGSQLQGPQSTVA